MGEQSSATCQGVNTNFTLGLERLLKGLRLPPGGRGRCLESACAIRTLRFFRAVQTHCMGARQSH
ncbi:hypothetical protein FCG19_20840 [Xanthomonas hortorum pv. vitians]|nr:hypothetical protein [Xanthomonas hortorum pv. vitians]NMI37226.1 hypothetical protein [Xanthomonas hortorum pv. vitians]